MSQASGATIKRMNRLDLTRRVVEAADDALIVAGIGNAGFDLHLAGERGVNFYMLGSMGLAVPIGLGLALAQPRRAVVVLEGDGSSLMNLGALATVGRYAPENLTIVIWDNAQWQITGGQLLATATTCDIAAVGAACGIADATTPGNPEAFGAAVRRAVDSPGPHLLVAHIDDSPATARQRDDPIAIKLRFMQALGVTPD